MFNTTTPAAASGAADTTQTEEKIYDLDDIVIGENGAIEEVHTATGTTDAKGQPLEAAAGASAAPTTTTPDTTTTTQDAPTALDLFLEERGIVGGKLVYGEQEVEFKALPPADQLEVLRQLVNEEAAAPSLDGDIKHVKDLLDAGKSIKDVAREILADELAGTGQLSVDDLNILDIKEKYPLFSQEEIEIELDERKASRLYDKKSEVLREKYASTNETNLEALATAARAQVEADNEIERTRILSAASELTEVDGWQLNDEIKNYVLADLIETDEAGNSKFVNVQDDPREQFKMAYYYKMMPQIVSYFQQQATSEYERGKAEAIGGFPPKPINTGTGASVNVQNNNTRVREDHDDNLMTVTEIG